MKTLAYFSQAAFAGPAKRVLSHKHLFDLFFTLVGVNFLLAGLSFVSTLFIANILGKERFGDLSYAVAVGGYCLTIVYCGLEQTLVRDLVQNPARFGEIVSASLLLRGILLTLVMAGLLGFDSITGTEGELALAGMSIAIAEGFKGLYLAQVYDALGSMKRHAYYLLAERGLYFTGIWILVIFFREKLSLQAIAALMILSTTLGFMLQYSWAKPRIKFRLDREVFAVAWNMVKGNFWIWSAILATLSFGGLSKIVLKHVSGSSELGGYSVAWQVVIMGSILIAQVTRIGNLSIARIVQAGVPAPRRVRFLIRYALTSTAAGVAIGLPAILFPGEILRVFRPEYASAQNSLRILGAYVILIAMGQVASQYLIAVRKERIYSAVVVVSGGLSILLYCFCIPKWAASGAAFAVLVSHGAAIASFVAFMIRDLAVRSVEEGAAK